MSAKSKAPTGTDGSAIVTHTRDLPRIDGSRIIYPIMRFLPEMSDGLSWSSTSDLTEDPLDSSSTVFLANGEYEDLTSDDGAIEIFPLMHAIFADWRYLEAHPGIDPVDWIEQRTVLFAGRKSSRESITLLQTRGWLAPRIVGIEISPRYNVVRDHRTGRPHEKTYAIAFTTNPGHYLTVNLHPSARPNRRGFSTEN